MPHNLIPYEFLEHTADIRLRVYGSSLSELFSNAALGMMEFMFGKEALNIVSSCKEEVFISSDSLETLLVDWLSKILFFSLSKGVAFTKYELIFISKFALRAEMHGSPAIAREDIKAVTHYDLALTEIDGRWATTVTFDI